MRLFRKARFIASVALIAAAFGAGFQVATWRADARLTRELEQRAKAQRSMAEQMAEATRAANERTYMRESELLGAIDAERNYTEGLRREIQDRPVIRQTVHVPVAGVCPAVPTIELSVFVDSYNRAATGAAASPADGRDAVVLTHAANASD